MAETEHHWHSPTAGQVTKAMKQYFADMGVTVEKINESMNAHIQTAVGTCVASLVNSQRFDALIVAAVASYIKNEKEVFDRSGGYGLVNHVRDLIRKELQSLLTDGYEVIVKPKGTK